MSVRIVVLALALHVGACMTDAQAQGPADAKKVTLANAVIDAMDFEGRYDRLVPRVQIANNEVADAAAQAMLAFNKKYLGPTQLRPLFADAYAKLFTIQELHGLVTWYASPLGRKHETAIPALIAAAHPLLLTGSREQAQRPANPKTVALANAVLDALDFEESGDRRVAQTTIAIDAGSSSAAEALSTINKGYVKPGQLRLLIAGVYATLFTEQELRDLVAWYASPLGRKLEATRPALAETGHALIERVYREHSGELREALRPGVPY